ncbi:hypothetical protein WR25_20275 [Diploscapter pachys]|uniref:Uncharacterized protein n=1 Tax=Diploscapter pachys TaxID=2018661 RepID=A0A2A2LPF2_9BILA|nr:hypothetical protein WR25_20275 [Diploscapter pachys]
MPNVQDLSTATECIYYVTCPNWNDRSNFIAIDQTTGMEFCNVDPVDADEFQIMCQPDKTFVGVFSGNVVKAIRCQAKP